MKYKNELKMSFSMIIKRGHYLYFFYYWMYSLIYDMKISKMRLDKTIFNSDEDVYPVQCISYPYIRELVKNISLNEEDVLVDVGCAWGRLIGYLQGKCKIKKYIGIELNESVAQTAQAIFNKDKDVDIISGDITKNIPDDATIYYLFNPFSDKILRAFLNALREKKAERKKTLKIWYLHPVHEAVFRDYEEWKLVDVKKICPRFMGEIVLNCYIEEN